MKNPKSHLYVQYGCGLSAPAGWMNFDASPTLRIQKIPILRVLLRPYLQVEFPSTVRYGDIVRGLPVPNNSCSGVYCSHVVEHLPLESCKIALRNTYLMLEPGGRFRCVVPDLDFYARAYIRLIDQAADEASYQFMDNTFLGRRKSPRGISGRLRAGFGNSNHQWMWDKYSLAQELNIAGFEVIRLCVFNDSDDEMFKAVESIDRFTNAIAFECIKLP